MISSTKILLTSAAFLLFNSLTLGTVLNSFNTCSSLKNYMVTNAIKRVGAWGLRAPNSCFFGRRNVGPLSFAKSAPRSKSSSNPVAGVDFSATNVQVSGVDEPDFVKTDGTRVFALKNNEFFYVQIFDNGSKGKVITNVTLPYYPRDMLFDPKSNSVVIISQTYEQVPPFKSSLGMRLHYPYDRSRPLVTLHRISVSQPRNVKITDTSYIQGKYISARSVGGVATIVLSYDGSDHIRFVKPGGKITQQQATKKNIEIVKKLSLSEWVPQFNATGIFCRFGKCRTYTVRRSIAGCSVTFFPKDEFSGFSLLTVARFQISGPLLLSGSSIVADGNKVYATAESLYAATTEYQYDVDEFDVNIGRSFKTSFHKFELTSQTSKYIGSGQVTGSVLNQFSMHEYDGTFFVSTTDGAPWWGSRDTSVSKVSSFRVVPGKILKKVGEVGGLGKGERIYAVRYIADVAYIVTFRRVDPLYIVALSDVYNLKVTGELKIPGYSAYLHPIGPGRILGVGRDATDDGRTTGAKVSLFDVSNLAKPKELTSWTLKGSYTRAEWEHKAFLWWAPQKLAVLPLSVYNRDTEKRFIGSIVLEVADSGIKERGRISQSLSYGRTIRRNFVIARQNLWSMSYSSLQINDINSLKKKSMVPL